MKKILLTLLYIGYVTTTLHAEHNTSTRHKIAKTAQKPSSTQKPKTTKALEKEIQAQIEREKRYAREQKFYAGDEYNLSEKRVDPKALDNVPVIEPEYDFDITDVYRDDI